MTRNPEQIKINGIVYTKNNLHTLLANNTPESAWFSSVLEFLNCWFDDSDKIITHSSGSTGIPKEIYLTKKAMYNSARMTNLFFGLDETKTALLCLPASYIAGKMMVARALVGGFNLIPVESKANPFEDIVVEIDFAAITPYQLFHSHKTIKQKDYKDIIVGGGQVSAVLQNELQSHATKFYETYGMTETCSHIALRALNGMGKSDFFTILNGVSIQLDERNCLSINAPHLLDNEIITNDIVELKDENTFRWLGRFDSIINSGGIKISPEQVEKKLEKLLKIPFFISSLPDKKLGEKLILVLECSENELSNVETLLNQNASLFAKYEMPKEIFRANKFEYSESNKILKQNTLNKILESRKL